MVHIRLSSRALALVAGASLVFGTIGVTAPAFAEDQVAAPSVPVASPTAPASSPVGTIDYTGRLTQVSDATSANANVQLFRVVGSGYLRVDLSKVQLGGLALADVTLRFAVPSALTLSADADTKFQQLAAYSTGTKSLVATAVVSAPPSRTKAMVNQSPATAAVHSIYAVLVTPKEFPGTTASASQTEAKVRASITHADTFWSNQSGGKVHFQLAGTTTWYKSTKSCLDDSSAIWTEAAAKATSQLGYRDAFNSHLALFFPDDPTGTICAGALGLGTVGYSVNSGGWVWVEGSDAPISQAALAHELGHNLTFGHADLLNCNTSDPHPGFLGDQGCTLPESNNASNGEYGDVTDVMGFGITGKDGGAVSSPNAIRSGIWSSDAYVTASTGTNSYVLNPVSSHSGLRSVVVEDTDGVNYFVEFRNQSNEDAQYATYGCDADSCVSSTPSVRVMRLGQQNVGDDATPLYFKGLDGDDTYLIGRNIGGTEHFDYHAGEQFSSKAVSGVVISVSSIDANTATVSVTRPQMAAGPNWATGQYIGIFGTLSHDNTPRVGDTWTVMIDAHVTAQHYEFQWYRAHPTDDFPSPIDGATQQSYLLTAADRGNYIGVQVTALGDGNVEVYQDPSQALYTGYGPIAAPVTDPLPIGSVAVTNGPTSLQAAPAGWPSGTTYAYQWFRDATAITGATSATYAPTVTDQGHTLKVRLVGSKSGFLPATTFSDAKNYSITVASGSLGSPTITPAENPQRVGDTLSVNSTLTFQTVDGPLASPTVTYQWFRTGVAIAGATASTYALAAADISKVMTVSVTVRSGGYAPYVATSPATPQATVLGFIPINTAPIVQEPNATHVLVSTIAPDSIGVSGTTTTYQWFRGTPGAPTTTAITGATAANYTLGSADVGKVINVEYIVNKAGYAPSHAFASATGKNYTSTQVDPTERPVISGTTKVGGVLSTTVPAYTTVDGAVAAPSVAYQWYRSGIAVTGTAGTSPTYTLTASDYAKTISVRVTGGRTGYLAVAATSLATPAITVGVIAGSLAVPIVTENNTTLALTASLPVGSITEPGVAYAWQWYRAGVAIPLATKAGYTLTSADYGRQIHVRVIVTKLDYTPVTRLSVDRDYSLTAAGPLTVGTVFKVGNVLTGSTLTYSTVDGSVSPTPTYQWYRNGVAISGQTAATYALVAADYNTVISLKQSAKVDGFLPVTVTSAGTPKIGLGDIQGTLVVDVKKESGSFPLTADPHGITELPVSSPVFQWYRSGVAIVGATHDTYTPTALDYGKTVNVRVTYTKPGYTPKFLVTTAVDYSLKPDYHDPIGDHFSYLAVPALPRIVGDVVNGNPVPLSVATPIVTVAGVAIDPSQYAKSYQWYRAGVAIAGAIGKDSTYTPGPLDVGKGISVAVTITSPGYLPITTLSPRTQLVGVTATTLIPGADGQFHASSSPSGVSVGITLGSTDPTGSPRPAGRSRSPHLPVVSRGDPDRRSDEIQLHADHVDYEHKSGSARLCPRHLHPDRQGVHWHQLLGPCSRGIGVALTAPARSESGRRSKRFFSRVLDRRRGDLERRHPLRYQWFRSGVAIPATRAVSTRTAHTRWSPPTTARS